MASSEAEDHRCSGDGIDGGGLHRARPRLKEAGCGGRCAVGAVMTPTPADAKKPGRWTTDNPGLACSVPAWNFALPTCCDFIREDF